MRRFAATVLLEVRYAVAYDVTEAGVEPLIEGYWPRGMSAMHLARGRDWA